MHRRARFIWTVNQPIDGAAAFRVFLGRVDQRDDGPNRWFLLRRRLELPSIPDDASLTLTVDGRYQLFVNGTPVGRGPMRCSPLFQRTDTHDLRPWLRQGENVLAVLVHVYGVDTAWYESAKGQWQPVFGDGGLWCEGRARCGAETIEIRSDLDWRILECAAWERDTPRSNWGLGFIEVHDARRMPIGWSEPGFDDSAWDVVQELTFGAGPPDAMLGGFAVEPFPTLVPRELPFLAESPVAAERVVRTFAVTPQPDLPIDRRLYEEALRDTPDGMIEDADALLRDDDTVIVVRTTADADAGLLLDFGRIHSGHPFMELDAEGARSSRSPWPKACRANGMAGPSAASA